MTLGSLAAAGLPSVKWLGRPFRIQRDRTGVAFWLGDYEAWVIDTGQVSGSPDLRFVDGGSYISIVLRQALFPGTTLPAGFECLLKHEVHGWSMLLHTEAGMRFRVPFVNWLSRVRLAAAEWPTPRLEVPGVGKIKFTGQPTVELGPDWKFQTRSKSFAELNNFLSPFPASEISFGLGETTDDCLSGSPLAKRTLIALTRGKNNWHVPIEHKSSGGWKIEAEPNPFDSLLIETGESGGQRIHTALFHESSDSARLRFFPGGNTAQASGEPFRLNLTTPHLITTLGQSENESALLASFANERTWLCTSKFSLEVGGGNDTRGFELRQRGGELERLLVSPQLFRSSMPGSNELAAMLTFDPRSKIQFVWDTVAPAAIGGLSLLRFFDDDHQLCPDLDGCTLAVTRVRDLLRLDFRFQNLKWDGDELKPAEPQNPAKLPTITVIFPPQNVGEQAFYEAPPGFILDGKHFKLPGRSYADLKKLEPELPPSITDPPLVIHDEPTAPPVKARIAEPSSLVFTVPQTVKSIPFKLSHLLDWKEWDLKVHPVAKSQNEAQCILTDPQCKSQISRPDGYTSIEMPYRVMLSPHGKSTWAHEIEPVDHDTEFTELWHTRLSIKKLPPPEAKTGPVADERDSANRTVRAIWSPDFRAANATDWPEKHVNYNKPFRSTMDDQDRHEVVHLTSNYNLSIPTECVVTPGQNQCQANPGSCKPYVPGAIQAEQLMLSSLGGWLKSRGAWEPPAVDFHAGRILTVEEWRHIATMGRDQYVRIVYKGYLMPFGHRAALIKVTERKVQKNADGIYGAYLRQRMYIVVREVDKHFPAFGQYYDGRQFPFRTVRAVTMITPTLDDPNTAPDTQSSFWPKINARPYEFQFRLFDVDGGSTLCSLPVYFVDNAIAFSQTESSKAMAEYISRKDQITTFPSIGPPIQKDVLRRDREFKGQKISFAPANQPGDTQYDTDRIKFTVDGPNLNKTSYECLYVKGQPFFYPEIDTANLNPAAVRRITNNQDAVTVKFTGAYLDSGFEPAVNRGEVFLEIDGRLDLSFGGKAGKADQAGGVITPNMSIMGFSRKNGPIGGGGRSSAPVRLALAPANGRALQIADLPALKSDAFSRDLIVNQKRGNPIRGSLLGTAAGSLILSVDGTPTTIDLANVQEILGAGVSAIGKVQGGEFDPLDYFGGALQSAKILGGISLWDIIKPLAAGAISNLGKAPKILEETAFPAIQNLLEIERRLLLVLENFPQVAQSKLATEMKEVRDSFALANANPKDLVLQARLIRSFIRLSDRLQSILQNPSQLLDAALQQLVAPFHEFEDKLKAGILTSVTQWRRIYESQLDAILNQVVGLALQGIVYEDQLRHYVDEVQQIATELKSELKAIEDLTQDIAAHPELMIRILGPVLIAEVPALAKLDENRKRIIALAVLAKNKANLGTIEAQLKSVEEWTITQAATVEKLLYEFDTLCLIWIATLPEDPNLPLNRTVAQQMVRQVVTAARKITDIKPGDPAVVHIRKEQEVCHRQLLTGLQQLQSMATNPTRLPLTTLRAAAVPTDAQAVALKINELAAEFTIVKRALQSANLETILSAFEPLLPPDLKKDLADLRVEIAGIRASITNASNDAKLTLVTLYMRLFDLWVKYQDPYKLAADVFGLNNEDIQRLKALEAQYQETLTLARNIQTGLKIVRDNYQPFINDLPVLARDLILHLTKPAEVALENAVNSAVDDALMRLEVIALQAVADLYGELIQRIQHPLEELPKLSELKSELESLLKEIAIPDSITLSYEWRPDVKNFLPVFEIEGGPGHPAAGALTIKARITTHLLSPGDPEVSVDGSLTNFTVNLIGGLKFISIDFAHFNFNSRNGSKPHCDVLIRAVTLSDQFSFVKKLQELLSPSDKDGPFIELDLLSIRAGFRYGLPAITVGAFSLRQLRIIVALNLPFSGEPMRCEFALSERNHPFLLSVGTYGGGGFLRMRLGLDGVEMIEGALEFGVMAQISIGIATGSGFIVAGIYFSVEKSRSKVCGFVHANGHLDVIGLISVDLDVLVQICYSTGGNVEGEAQIVIHIEYMFFSIDIELHAHYQFAGSGSPQESDALKAMAEDPCRPKLTPPPDPLSFCDLASASQFASYRKAFAW